MKFLKHGVGFMMMAGLLTACTASRQGTSINNKSINGNWTLQTINTEGINTKFAAEIFNEADLNCFVGSGWSFSSVDNTGSYKLAGGTKGCQTLQRNIRWTFNDQAGAGAPKEFQFKRLDDNKKNIDDSSGFRLSVTMLDKNSMQLKSAITFEGKPGNIVYNFVKR